MAQTSGPMDISKPTFSPYHGDLIQNAVLAIRTGVGADWKNPADAISIIADDSSCSRLSNAISTADYDQPDWEEDVLKPLLDDCLDTYAAIDNDTKVSVYATAVVLLAYDIILQRNAALTQADYEFTENAFDTFLSSESLVAIIEVVNTEIGRCSGRDDDFAKLNALFVLENLLSEAAIRSEQIAGLASDFQAASTDICLVETPISASLVSTVIPSPPQSHIVTRDVHIQYYLNPGCTLEVNSVTAIDIPREALMLETNVGQRVRIEEGVIVSEVNGKNQTVEIRAPTADGFDLSATIITSPGNSYTIDDVLSIEQMEEMPDWVIMETPKATIWVGNGPYALEHTGASIKVKNVYESG